MNSTLPTSLSDPRVAVTAASAPTSSSNGAKTSSAGSTQQFSTSDFMKLLVAEMKNQDPTAPTDPTQFVQQLVGVNSLQQLIQINQGINGTAANTNITQS